MLRYWATIPYSLFGVSGLLTMVYLLCRELSESKEYDSEKKRKNPCPCTSYVFPPVLFRYTWHAALYKFKMYCMMTWNKKGLLQKVLLTFISLCSFKNWSLTFYWEKWSTPSKFHGVNAEFLKLKLIDGGVLVVVSLKIGSTFLSLVPVLPFQGEVWWQNM